MTATTVLMWDLGSLSFWLTKSVDLSSLGIPFHFYCITIKTYSEACFFYWSRGSTVIWCEASSPAGPLLLPRDLARLAEHPPGAEGR